MKIFEPFNSVKFGCIAYYGSGAPVIDDTRSYPAGKSVWKGKAGIYFESDEYVSSIKNELVWKKSIHNPFPTIGDRVYVSKDSKISRDALRNCGYVITLSPEKANYILMPYFDEGKQLDGDVIVYNNQTNELILFYVEYRSRSNFFPGLEVLVQNAIEAAYGIDNVDVYFKVSSEGFCKRGIWFIPNCEEYKALLGNKSLVGPYYIWDIDIPMVGSVSINPETLIVWGKMDDTKILEKQLVNSDWQKYPVTVLAVLETKDQYLYSDFGPQGQLILNTIHFKESAYRKQQMMFTPEDYAMFQAWAFAYLGISEKGGYVDVNKFSSIPSRYRDMLKFRMAVMPITLDKEMPVSNVKNLNK